MVIVDDDDGRFVCVDGQLDSSSDWSLFDSPPCLSSSSSSSFVLQIKYEENDEERERENSHLFLGDQVILFSFFNLLRALANQVETCVKVILVIMAR